MLEVLSYTFFWKALIAGCLVSLISGTLWSLVILRREPNITHSIANILFLGIVISFFFQGNYHLFGIMFAILWVFFLTFIEKLTPTSPESSKEIIAQIGLAWGIFWVGLLWNIQLDIFNFLFWNILFVETLDIIILIALLIIGTGLWIYFGRTFLKVALSPEISKSQWIKVSLYEFGYLIYLAIFIAISLKIFWVLLLWAFLVLPGNIGKILAKSLKWVFLYASVVSLLSVIGGLFISYYMDTSAGATTVLLLGFIFLSSTIYQYISK